MMPYSKEEARAAIARLVKDFQRVEAGLQKIPEAEIEKNYVRPLFRYLNWNVESAGLPVEQWEFLTQRRVGQRKRPDYILRLGGKDLLVMDAKAAEQDIHDLRYLNQVYAYAYSTQSNLEWRKIDFAILTDFQEFVVLDCTLYASRPEVIPTFRILDWRYTDYVDKFDELWELFERNNVLAASREKKTGLWARYLSPRQVKANRIPPDQAFFDTLDEKKSGWRVKIAKDMKKNNPDLEGDIITAAVQLLINRLIFVKVLSDREVEEDYLAQLAEVVEQEGLADEDFGWFAACDKLFVKLNKTYNGSVFASRPELEAVKVSNRAIREVVCDLKPENSPYNFAVLPVEILGTIYERFLRRVVRTTDHQVKIEDKPEVGKASGVYYTPQYIVDYIVENTVGKLLADCRTPAAVARLRILDPACGSGGFLLGAYDALIEWHKAYYGSQKLSRKNREAAYYDDNGGLRLTAKLKRNILLNNIFGVDIDPQAVELTRFSLSLKALEDIRHDELYQELSLFKETILPGLSSNIQCGNSLIALDFYDNQQMNFWDSKERRRINAFDWKTGFPQIFKGDNPGFDVVIGNPPWGGDIDRELDYFHSKYPATTQEHTDSFKLFIENGLRLTQAKGLGSMIVPNPLLRQRRLKDVRAFLLEHQILSLVDLGENVFKGVVAPSCIFIVRKQAASPIEKISLIQIGHLSSDKKAELLKNGTKQGTRVAQAVFATNPELEFMSFAKQFKVPVVLLGDFHELKCKDAGINYQRVQVGMQEKGKSDLSERLLYEGKRKNARDKMFWKGSDIDRYWMAETTQRFCRPNYQDFIKKNEVVHLNNDIYQIVPKILIRQTADHMIATLDERGIWFGRSIIALVPAGQAKHRLEYILGILNSRYMKWLYQNLVQETGRVFAQVKLSKIKQLPIRLINFNDQPDRDRHDRMVELVLRMLELTKQLASIKTEQERIATHRLIENTDQKIDNLVYELYSLNEEEIGVVEEAAK